MAIASGTCGTCTWTISDAGKLSIRPTSGNSGYLLSERIGTSWPWQDYAEEVRSAVFSGSIYFYRKQWSGQQPIETGEAQYLFAVLDGLVLSERRYSNLTSITGFGSLKNLVDISNMFGSCTALTTLDLSSLDTTNVTEMGGMFYNCNLLSSVTFGNLFSTENVEKSEEPFFGKGTNTTNGIIVQNDSGFMKLTASQRAGTWERGVAPSYSAVAFRTAGGVPDTSGEDVEIDVTWATDASTTTRTLKIYKKLSSTTSYPSTAEVTRNLSGNSGIESITLTNVGSEAYDFKVEFYDGTNTFIAFPAVIANKDLVTLDQSGNLWTAGSVTIEDKPLTISNANINQVNTTIDLKETNNGITAAKYYAHVYRDKNNKEQGRFGFGTFPDGRTRTEMTVRNYDANGNQVGNKGFSINMDKAGNVTYSVTTPSAFRKAIDCEISDATIALYDQLAGGTSWRE